jgi:glycosyltransferase involved in cell wall biosynthesis
MSKLGHHTVGHYSESVFTVDGHGVHVAMMQLAQAQQKLGITVKINPKGPEAIMHFHSAGPFAYLRLLRHRRIRVTTAHVTPYSLHGSIRWAPRLDRLVSAYLRSYYNKAHLIIAVSETSANELREIGVRPPIEVIPNGLDADIFRRSPHSRAIARETLGIETNARVVLTVGQIQPRKGIADFIELAERFPELSFIWVGDTLFGAASDGRKEIRRTLAKKPENLHFTGQVEHERVSFYYHAADIFVSLSSHETFGLAPVEAGMASLPLVLSKLPVFEEIFSAGAEASYLACQTLADYESAIRELLDSTSKREELARRAEEVMSAYTSETAALRTFASYQRLLMRSPTSRPPDWHA